MTLVLPSLVASRLERELGPDWQAVALAEQVDAAIVAEMRASAIYLMFLRVFARRLELLMQERGCAIADVLAPALEGLLGPDNLMGLEVVGALLIEDVVRAHGFDVTGCEVHVLELTNAEGDER